MFEIDNQVRLKMQEQLLKKRLKTFQCQAIEKLTKIQLFTQP